MKDVEKDKTWILWLLGLPFICWFAILIAPAIGEGLPAMMPKLIEVLKHPFRLSWCEKTLPCVGVLIAIYGFLLLIYHYTKPNYRRREEHGSAKWGKIKKIVKKYVQEPEEENAPPTTFDTEEIATITSSDLSIHFLELGNKYTGDCTLIKVGDTEVLIDAGSRKGSAATIVPYINQFCTDGVLEYVIATHAHQDHIAGFVGTASADGVFESFVCETIIDYALSNSDAAIRDDYEELRDEEVANGAKHYTVLECWNNENGASRSYTLGDGITMNFLYQRFYEEEIKPYLKVEFNHIKSHSKQIWNDLANTMAQRALIK